MPGNFPGGHALVIGVDTYLYSEERGVPNTALDAGHVYDVLVNPSLCGYDKGNMQLYRGSDAARAKIIAELETYSFSLKDTDTLLIYYAGHGMYDYEGRYYLTAHDTQFVKIGGKTFVKPETAICDTDLIKLLRQIPVKRLVTIFNACHSGNISPGTLGETAAEDAVDSFNLPDIVQHEILATGEGRVVITACRSGQSAYYEKIPGKLTVFGQALVDGLSGQGDIPNKKGYISLFDLYEFLHGRVQNQVYNWWKQQQEPVLTVQELVGSFPISLHQGSTASSLGESEFVEPIPQGAVNQIPEIRLTLTLADLPKTIANLQDPLILQQLLLPKSAGKPEISSDDYELISFYRICFTRPAFQWERTHEQNLWNLDEAVKDTITAINTGCLLDRITKVVLKTHQGKLFLTNERWNLHMGLISELLQKIRNTIKVYLDSEPEDRDKGNVMEIINVARIQVMKQFNQILEEAGIPKIAFEPGMNTP